MPQQIIDIPGVGEVEFPDTMNDEQVAVAAKKLHDERMGGDLLVDNVKNIAGTVGDVATGFAKGAADTAVGLGRLVHKIPGVSEGVDKLYDMAGVPGMDSAQAFEGQNAETGLGLDATNTAQKVGKFIEQGAEYAIPVGGAEKAAAGIAARIAPNATGAAARVLPKVAANAAASAGVAAAHGDDMSTAAMLGGAIPVVGAVAGGVANASKGAASRFVRAAIKPTVTEMKQTAGASHAGLDNVANRLAQFIIDHRLTSPEQAQAIINEAESTVQSMVGGQATDAPARAARYLSALERSAAKQGLGASDVATIRNAAAELANGPMGRDVVTATTTMQPGKILNAQGQPVMTPVTSHQTTRALRPSVPADEALTSARASSKWSTRKSWGELKGADTEASKAVERAQRDAVKVAVPESRPVFNTYSKAIKARDVLSRMAFRQGNRDVVGMPQQIVAGHELLQGRPPIMALAANYVRDNQLKLGIWADKLGNAIKNNDVQTVTGILGRFGVSLAADQPDNSPDMERELLQRQVPR